MEVTSMKRPTTRQFQAYIRVANRPWMEGITHNDTYNVQTFGIDRATYDRIDHVVSVAYGFAGRPANLDVPTLRRLFPR